MTLYQCAIWPNVVSQDNAAFIKTKINNSGVLCLGYTQALRPGVKAAFGLALDT